MPGRKPGRGPSPEATWGARFAVVFLSDMMIRRGIRRRVRGRNKCRLSNTKSGEARARQSRQSAGSWSDLPYISKGLKDPIVTTVASAFGMVSAPVQGTCLYLPSTLVPQYPVGIRVCTPKGLCKYASCIIVGAYRLPRFISATTGSRPRLQLYP